jgi:hypothetical protein
VAVAVDVGSGVVVPDITTSLILFVSENVMFVSSIAVDDVDTNNISNTIIQKCFTLIDDFDFMILTP